MPINFVLVRRTKKNRCEFSLPCLAKPCLDHRSLIMSLKTWKMAAGKAALD